MTKYTPEKTQAIAKEFNVSLDNSVPMLTEKLTKGFDALAEQDITSKEYGVTINNVKDTVDLLTYAAKIISMTANKSNTIKFNKEKK